VTVKAGTEFGVRLDREVSYNVSRRFVDTREYYRAEQRRASESSQDGSKNNRLQSKDINVTLNGRAVSFVKSRPVEENGYVLVPLDPVMKAAGVSYKYNERQEVVRVQTDQGNVRIKIGKPVAWIDKDKENIEGPAQLRNGEVFVPLHFLAIATEMRVIWDAKSRTVTMTSLSGRVMTQR